MLNADDDDGSSERTASRGCSYGLMHWELEKQGIPFRSDLVNLQMNNYLNEDAEAEVKTSHSLIHTHTVSIKYHLNLRE